MLISFFAALIEKHWQQSLWRVQRDVGVASGQSFVKIDSYSKLRWDATLLLFQAQDKHKATKTQRERKGERDRGSVRVCEWVSMTGKQTTHKRANKQTKLRQKQQTNGQSSHMETEEQRRNKRERKMLTKGWSRGRGRGRHWRSSSTLGKGQRTHGGHMMAQYE